jgi:cell wall-associated NlpC family hydrolase
MPMSVTLALTTFAGNAAAEPPAPSARDVAKSRQVVRDRAADVGRIKARLAGATGELDRLSATAEAAMERYNGELVQLAQAGRTYENTQRRLAQADQHYKQIRTEAAVFAAAAYRAGTGYNAAAAAVSGQGGPQGMLDRASLVEILAHQEAGTVDRVHAAQVIADMFRRQAQAALAARQEATRRAAAAKEEAQKALAWQQREVRRITAYQATLVGQLGTARARATELQRERSEYLRAGRRSGVALRNASGRGGVAARAALRWLGTPYSWGGGTVSGPSFGIAYGAGTKGFDCSGLAVYAWGKAGVRLDHWTGTQWTSGPHVPTGLLRPGDLVFFANNVNSAATIHHVGIFIGRGQMVEAPFTGGRVRISSIWRNGFIGATRPTG